MPLVAAWKNQLVEKVQEQGGVFCVCVTTRSTFTAFKTHSGYTFTILTPLVVYNVTMGDHIDESFVQLLDY